MSRSALIAGRSLERLQRAAAQFSVPPEKAVVDMEEDASVKRLAAEYYQIAGPDADFVIGGDLRSLDYSSRLATLRIPTLVVGGRADGIVLPSFIQQFRSVMPQAQVVIFEHSGHFPFIEQQADLLELLIRFLSRR